MTIRAPHPAGTAMPIVCPIELLSKRKQNYLYSVQFINLSKALRENPTKVNNFPFVVLSPIFLLGEVLGSNHTRSFLIINLTAVWLTQLKISHCPIHFKRENLIYRCLQVHELCNPHKNRFWGVALSLVETPADYHSAPCTHHSFQLRTVLWESEANLEMKIFNPPSFFVWR